MIKLNFVEKLKLNIIIDKKRRVESLDPLVSHTLLITKSKFFSFYINCFYNQIKTVPSKLAALLNIRGLNICKERKIVRVSTIINESGV